jgi:hypothetical protein
MVEVQRNQAHLFQALLHHHNTLLLAKWLGPTRSNVAEAVCSEGSAALVPEMTYEGMRVANGRTRGWVGNRRCEAG